MQKVLGFPDGPDGEESACHAGDLGSIPRAGRSPGEENSYPVQYSHSILAWKIPWTEEPGRLQYMGSQMYKYIHIEGIMYHFNFTDKEI